MIDDPIYVIQGAAIIENHTKVMDDVQGITEQLIDIIDASP